MAEGGADCVGHRGVERHLQKAGSSVSAASVIRCGRAFAARADIDPGGSYNRAAGKHGTTGAWLVGNADGPE